MNQNTIHQGAKTRVTLGFDLDSLSFCLQIERRERNGWLTQYDSQTETANFYSLDPLLEQLEGRRIYIPHQMLAEFNFQAANKQVGGGLIRHTLNGGVYRRHSPRLTLYQSSL